MTPIASTVNLNRSATYNLACDFKDQIQEVENNWEADLRNLQIAKRSRHDMQQKLRVLRILLEYERETTTNLGNALRETKGELQLPDWDSFDSTATYEEPNSFSSDSVYSEADGSIVFNTSPPSNHHSVDNASAGVTLASEIILPTSVLDLSAPPLTPKPSRSAHWKQLVAAFLPTTHPYHSRLAHSPIGSDAASPLPDDSSRSRRRLLKYSSLRSHTGDEGSEAKDWRATVGAAGGRFNRRR